MAYHKSHPPLLECFRFDFARFNTKVLIFSGNFSVTGSSSIETGNFGGADLKQELKFAPGI
jgi:hypothetical protein